MTLTEQWKKGELPYGNYYVKNIYGNVVNDIYQDNKYDEWILHSDREIREVLAPVPSYEEYLRLGKKIKKRCIQIQKVTSLAFKRKKEIKKLKELLKQSLRYVWTVRNDVRTEYAGATNEQIDMLIENIDNAIGADNDKK